MCMWLCVCECVCVLFSCMRECVSVSILTLPSCAGFAQPCLLVHKVCMCKVISLFHNGKHAVKQLSYSLYANR